MEEQKVMSETGGGAPEVETEERQLSPDEEIAGLEKLLSEEPDDFQAGGRLGELYCGKGRLDDALTEVKKAVEMAEGLRTEMDRSLAMYYSNLGTIYGTKGMMDDARPQFERRPLRDNAPAHQERDAVAEALRLVHVVRRKQDGRVVVGAHLADERLHLELARRVEARRRFVEQHQHRRGQERPRDGDLLLLSSREVQHRVADAVPEAESIEDLL